MTMLIYSDSEDQAIAAPSKPSTLFGPNKPLHSIFGGRKVGDILLWRNKRLSASILVGFTIIWFLFEVVELHFITLASYLLMTSMLTLFIWTQAANFFNWRPPTMYHVQVSESTAMYILSRLNKLLTKFYRISSGYDMARFFVVIAFLWISSIIGSYSDVVNVLYVVFLCLITIPVLYERYEREANYIATQGRRDMKKLYNKLDSKILSKIPRGPVKEKRYM